jgi:hypothetical protein
MNEGRRRMRQRPRTALAPGKRSAQARMGSRAGGVSDQGRQGETPQGLDAQHASATLPHAMRQGDARRERTEPA